MTDGDHNIHVERRGPRTLVFVDIAQRDWDRLAEKCRDLPIPSLGRATWLSIFSGGLLSSVSLAATVLLDDSPSDSTGALWIAVGLLGAISGLGVVLNALALRRERSATASSRQAILDDIQFIEESWSSPEESDVPVPGTVDYYPGVGELTPNEGTIPADKFSTLEFSGFHSAGYHRIRWVRLILGTSRRWNRNWPNQIYLSINPDGRLHLWDSAGKSHLAELPANGQLETDTATIDLEKTELTTKDKALHLRLSIRPKIVGEVRAFLTTVSNPDKADTGIVEVGQLNIG